MTKLYSLYHILFIICDSLYKFIVFVSYRHYLLLTHKYWIVNYSVSILFYFLFRWWRPYLMTVPETNTVCLPNISACFTSTGTCTVPDWDFFFFFFDNWNVNKQLCSLKSIIVYSHSNWTITLASKGHHEDSDSVEENLLLLPSPHYAMLSQPPQYLWPSYAYEFIGIW